MNHKDSFQRLREICGNPGTPELVDTYLESIHFFCDTEPVPRTPVLCDPGIIIIGQGQKTGYLNGKKFQYDEDHYLILSVPAAFECETDASMDNPLLGIFIDLDISKLNQLIEKVEKHSGKYSIKGSDIFCGVEPVEMDIHLHQATEKLLSCLRSPQDSDILGQAWVDEIIYRVLLGAHGKALVALTQQETHYARISQSLSHLSSNYMDKISIDDLAHQANMSASSFHRAFKFVTGESPLQYLKKTRLNKARFLIAREGLRVSTAADQVGYESVSQFSREFKRYFNVSPSSAKDVSYAAAYP